ncbi:MAG: ABC transporter permease [Actinomycetales bacterium]|uniref:ABC transporter permease n=1 Tax=Candidatus Phosphoribacter hodrii TaxID=2953743 RepID=A0A935CD00_9MICO|nr:ABC transporter permease [Candidatus Phosphoribacter hodrii]
MSAAEVSMAEVSTAGAVTAGATTAGAPSRPVPGWAWRFFWSEVRLIAGRRRNQAGLAVLAAVPVVVAFAVKASAPKPGRGPDFLSSITSNGLFVALTALTAEIAMFLPLAVAMLCGDAIAGEANQGTLRYLLTVPVTRTRLLFVKYASLVFGAFWGVTLVAVTGVLVGAALFGVGPLTTLSGSQLEFVPALGRLGLVVLYLTACLASLAAVGLFVSTLTEQPMAATITVMIVVILSWVLDGVPQVAWPHPWLIVHEWMSFGDLLRDPVSLDGAGRGLWVALGYAVVFLAAAWARLSGKDITS